MISNQIRREDIGYKLAKALEIRGQGTPNLNLDETVVPVVLVEDLSGGNEQDYAIHRWARGYCTSPAGLQFGKASFNNQLNSGVVMRIYRVDIFHSGIQAGVPLLHPSNLYAGGRIGFTIETASTGGTAVPLTKIFTDARLTSGTSARVPTMDIRRDNSGGIGVHAGQPFVPVTGYHLDFGGWYLTPGTRLHFEALDIDTEYRVEVEWTETNL